MHNITPLPIASTIKPDIKTRHLQVTSPQTLQAFTVSSSPLHLRTFSLDKNPGPLQPLPALLSLLPPSRQPPLAHARSTLSKAPETWQSASRLLQPRPATPRASRAPPPGPGHETSPQPQPGRQGPPSAASCALRAPSPEAARLRRKTFSQRGRRRRRRPQAPLPLPGPDVEAVPSRQPPPLSRCGSRHRQQEGPTASLLAKMAAPDGRR